ncbi:transmembrane protein 50A [Platysternon megacephalum]|uniref:Transmembrane protein 50A n=1 Tax=Platysternon megacephalum TaxID=55544 RepID=A0A4D9F275_9SAUR|nr:transmembrane protein 50A [Platysternon megacephalum]
MQVQRDFGTSVGTCHGERAVLGNVFCPTYLEYGEAGNTVSHVFCAKRMCDRFDWENVYISPLTMSFTTSESLRSSSLESIKYLKFFSDPYRSMYITYICTHVYIYRKQVQCQEKSSQTCVHVYLFIAPL